MVRSSSEEVTNSRTCRGPTVKRTRDRRKSGPRSPSRPADGRPTARPIVTLRRLGRKAQVQRPLRAPASGPNAAVAFPIGRRLVVEHDVAGHEAGVGVRGSGIRKSAAFCVIIAIGKRRFGMRLLFGSCWCVSLVWRRPLYWAVGGQSAGGDDVGTVSPDAVEPLQTAGVNPAARPWPLPIGRASWGRRMIASRRKREFSRAGRPRGRELCGTRSWE